MTIYTVFYMTPDAWPRFNFGQEFPTVAELDKTHKQVRVLRASDPEDVFYQMQGEVWSPNGEKRNLIKSLGLHHTSMSVGDVVYDRSTNKHLVVAPMGFKEIE